MSFDLLAIQPKETESTKPTSVVVSRNSSVIIHVPHAGLVIPVEARDRIVLSDVELEVEKLLMADTATDSLAVRASELCSVKPSLFVNRFSRLVIDPERFPDEREEMNVVGMGAVYLKTSAQRELRSPDADDDSRLIKKYFEPYANALEQLVDQVLDLHGRVTIIDLHSFGIQALPYELHGQDARPNLCIGTDSFHTSESLIVQVTNSFKGIGSIEFNQPFSGTYVPLKHYQQNTSVQSVMIELRKDSYGFGEADSEPFEMVASMLAKLVEQIDRLGEI